MAELRDKENRSRGSAPPVFVLRVSNDPGHFKLSGGAKPLQIICVRLLRFVIVIKGNDSSQI